MILLSILIVVACFRITMLGVLAAFKLLNVITDRAFKLDARFHGNPEKVKELKMKLTENTARVDGDTVSDNELWVFTQLEGWSKELHTDRELIKQYENTLRYSFNNTEKINKLNKKISALYKQVASDEKNIAKTCTKYNIDMAPYL